MCSNVIGGDSSDEIESNFFDDEFGNADNELQQIHELPEKNLKNINVGYRQGSSSFEVIELLSGLLNIT